MHWANFLQNLKRTLGPWHDLGLALARNPFLSHVDPHKVPGLELDSFLVLVDLLYDLRVHLLYSIPDLSMKIFDFLGSLLGFSTILGRNR